MNEIQFFIDRVREINREIGLSQATGFLENIEQHLTQINESNILYIDVIHANSPTAEVRKIIQHLQAGNGTFNYQFITPAGLMAKNITSIFASIAIIIIDDSLVQEDANDIVVQRISNTYLQTFIINLVDDENYKKNLVAKLGYKSKKTDVTVDINNLSALENELETVIPANKKDVLLKAAKLNSIKPLQDILQQIFGSEQKIVQARKLLSTQNQQITKKDEQSANIMDLANQIRQIIQKLGNEIDKNLKLKYDELSKPNTGIVTMLVVNEANAFSHFEKIDVAEKQEKFEVKIPEEFEHHFISVIKNKMSQEIKNDISFVQTSIEDALNRVNQLLSNKGLKSISVKNEEVLFPDYRNSIKPYIQFNREFKSEMMKKGLTEYFVALRDYTGVIMVATGLLAPLTIIANISENGFLKHLSNGIKFGMAGITIGLIFYGIYDLRKRIPRKREEEVIRETNKAQEYLTGEGKRIVTDISRDWLNAISAWIRDMTQIINNNTEKTIKEFQTERTNDLNKAKLQLQKQSTNVEAYARNISNAERIKDALLNKYRDMQMETEKNFTA